MPREWESIIIGGGIAGLACARRLFQYGRDFLLITDRLGGRMHAAAGSTRNFGAAYITADYKHVRRFVRPGPRMRLRDVFFPVGAGFVRLGHASNIRHMPALARLYSHLIAFRHRFNRLRKSAPHVCQAELLNRDSAMKRAAEEPAGDFIRRHRLADLDAIFANPVVNSTVFVGSDQVNTFYYLACLMPALVPTYLADLSGTTAALTDGFHSKIVSEKVIALEAILEGRFRVATARSEFHARQIVIAAPSHNVREFCPELDDARRNGVREIPVSTLHIAGRRRAEYFPGRTVFLKPGEPATVLLHLPGQACDIVFSQTGAPNLSAYYEEHRIIGQTQWKTAIQLSGPTWRPLMPRDNLYMIGDYNICGLEDSYLTGLFAANRILSRKQSPQPVPVPSRIDRISRQVCVEP